MTDPTAELPPLTSKQQQLLAQYRLLDKTFWEAHDAYSRVREAWKKAQAACLAAGFSPTAYPDSDACPQHYPAMTVTASANDSSDGFKTLCSYARNYIEEHGNHAEADELKRIIDSLSHRPAIPGTAAKADETLPAAPTAITTVAQLIKLLQSQPEDMRVVVDGYEGGYSDVKPQKLIQIPISLNVHPDDQWYYGNHGDPEGGMPAETVLLISRHEQ
jgi:hypothetical protein